jgi:hypothetical protein
VNKPKLRLGRKFARRNNAFCVRSENSRYTELGASAVQISKRVRAASSASIRRRASCVAKIPIKQGAKTPPSITGATAATARAGLMPQRTIAKPARMRTAAESGVAKRMLRPSSASRSLPQNILGILGLSQVVYTPASS